MLKTFTDVDCIFGEPDIEPYYHLATEEAELDTKIHRIVLQTRNALQVGLALSLLMKWKIIILPPILHILS